jgi:hypothetical protein
MKSGIMLTIGAVICVATAASGQEARTHPQVPVMIEHSPDGTPPCAYGIVHSLDPKGDGFLAVKAGPGLQYERIDKLYNGEQVIICGDKGAWYAIVYTGTRRQEAMGYCNVEESGPKTLPYTGPCRSGWAHRRWIKPISK